MSAVGTHTVTQRLRSRTRATSAHRKQARLRVVVRTREQGVERGGRGGVDRAATEVDVLGHGDPRVPELVGDDPCTQTAGIEQGGHGLPVGVRYHDWPSQSLESLTPRSIAVWEKQTENHAARLPG